MTRSVCERAALVEAMVDGRLGPTEHASIERHLKSCAECNEHLRAIASFQQALHAASKPMSAIDHQRARLALLRSAAASPESAAPKRRRSMLLLTAGLLMLPVAVWAATSALAPFFASDTTPAAPAARVPPPARASTHAARHAVPAPEAASQDSAPANDGASTIDTAMPAATNSDTPQQTAGRSSIARRVVGAKRTPNALSVSDSASRDFAIAVEAIARGDFGAGAEKLQRFTFDHAGDLRVEEAVYLHAIALERAGRVDEARAAARRYLADYPDGAHRTQARRLATSDPIVTE